MEFRTAKAKSDTTDTKVKDKVKEKVPEKASSSHESVEISKKLSNAITWLGTKFGTIRTWIGKDGGDYASITPKENVKCPEPYATVGDVAEAVIKSLKDVGEEAGMAVFASYGITFRGNKAVGRLISVLDDGRLCLALEVEYAVTNAKAGIQSMVPKAKAETTREEKVEVVEDDDAGFGKL
jgi:hypothetical protein